MKKIIILLFCIILIGGCNRNSARLEVENYLKKYNNLDTLVLMDLENVIEKENLDKDGKDKYREIIKKQYKDLKYKVIEEEYDEDVSYIAVKIEVYDLYKVIKDVNNYLDNNKEEFYDEENMFDINKFNNYKLDKMKNAIDRVEYTVVFTVEKEKDDYMVIQPTEDDLKKIHGIYNYEFE